VGVADGLFHFLEKAAELLKNTFKRVEKNLIVFFAQVLVIFWPIYVAGKKHITRS
jgi:hypothetical protein